MRTFKLALLGLMLSGCAHTEYLTRSCITQQDYDRLAGAEPLKVKGRLTGQADADIRPITGSAIELRAWGHALLDTLHVCAGIKDNHPAPGKRA